MGNTVSRRGKKEKPSDLDKDPLAGTESPEANARPRNLLPTKEPNPKTPDGLQGGFKNSIVQKFKSSNVKRVKVSKPPRKPNSEKTTNNVNGNNRFTNNLPDYPYSIRFAKAKVLIEMGNSIKKVREITGLAPLTIARIRDGERSVNQNICEILRKEENDKLTHLSHTILDSINCKDLEKAGLSQKAMSYGLLFDKRRVLENKPTQITQFSLEDTSVHDEIKRLEQELEYDKRQIVDAEVISDDNQPL